MPSVLVFIIKRFTTTHLKNSLPISINKVLTIKKGSVISAMNTDVSYQCTSMAYHFGGLSSGHYCAVCKTNDKFILYDDLNITQLQDENLPNIFDSNKDAYMIVYSTT